MSEAIPGEPLVHRLVAARAADTPRATALIHPGGRLDYASLWAAAAAFAGRLAELGVRPGHLVPVVAGRGVPLAVAQLGILASGAAFATLDPRWPSARLRALLSRLPSPVVVSDAPVERAGAVVEPLPGLVAASSPVDVGVGPDSAACVVFTSGSTGTPKGVVLPHRALSRLFRHTPPPGFGPGEVMPQAAAPWWDMYVWELFGQLMTGGTAVLPDSDHLLPRDLRAMVATHGVTSLRLTTSLFCLFVDEDPGCFAGLRTVLAGGEALPPGHAARFLAAYPEVPLYNGYGPAEACMHATTHRVGPGDDNVPLGTAVPGAVVGVCADDGRPCQPGEPGEIRVGGEGVALGYLDDPAATAAAFVDTEFPSGTVRAYRTGDIGLVGTDGLLRFLGRRDRQLKVGGHRVEPAEVEAAGRTVPGIRDCALLPVTGDDGQVTGTVLLYLADPGAEPRPSRLRAALRELLPAHLVPARLRAVPAFPLTANGKLDRRALAELVVDREGSVL